ncbi:MAG: DEAD/DEAH box helicase, partial [Thermoprotei archaeon]
MERWLWGEARELKWPMLKEGSIEYRAYQFNIARRALEGNTLVVMPTGLGKTIIAALVIGARLDEHPWGRCVLLAPTRPLALQHRDVLRRVLKLDPSLINVLTGETKPEERSKIWRKSKILILTPQTLKNDIVAGRYDLEDVVLMVFDEAHRAVGNYPYVFIAEHYVKAAKIPLILAMTASPGSDEKKIEEICRNLKIEKIEVRDESSPDVRPYIQSVQVVWRWVELSEGFEEAKNILEEILRPYLERFKERGYIESSSVRRVRLKDILEAMSLVQERMKDYVEPPRDLVEDLALLTNTARIVHALELLEAQGMHALWNYMRKLEERASRRGASRYLKELVMSHHWRRLRRVVEENLEEVHPKFKELLKVLKEYGRTASRIIVFTNYRSTADMLTKMLCKEGYK